MPPVRAVVALSALIVSSGSLGQDMMRHVVGEDLKIGSVLTWGPGWYFQKTFFEGKDNTTYTLDFYRNDGAVFSNLGEGQEYLSTETLTTDAPSELARYASLFLSGSYAAEYLRLALVEE